MGDRLRVESRETYEVSSGGIEEWNGADVKGTLDVEGTVRLTDDANTRPVDTDDSLDLLDEEINLPTGALNMTGMNVGFSMFLIGILGTMLGAVATFQNYIAGILLFFSVIALLLSGLFGIGLEIFWSFVAATAIALALGMVVRYAN